MNRLIVFNRVDAAEAYLRRLVYLNKENVASINTITLELRYKNGDVDRAAVIAHVRDVDRYRGLSINVLEFQSQPAQYVEECLRAMVRPLIKDTAA